MSNHDNGTDVLSKSINKTGSEIELVRIGIIGFKLFEEVCKFFDVLRNSGGMFDVKKLA